MKNGRYHKSIVIPTLEAMILNVHPPPIFHYYSDNNLHEMDENGMYETLNVLDLILICFLIGNPVKSDKNGKPRILAFFSLFSIIC